MTTLYQNHMVDGAQAQIDRAESFAESLDAARARAHKRLMIEMVDALESGDSARMLVSTPANGRPAMFAIEAVVDLAQYPGKDWIEVELFKLASVAAKSSDVVVRISAQAWMSRVAAEFAEHHMDDSEEVAEVAS